MMTRHRPPFVKSKYFAPVFAGLILLAGAILIVCFYGDNATTENHIVTAASYNRILFEEHERLNIELAALKAPQRIEAIARDHLQMCFPRGKC